jgi:hypothetical protein
VVDERREDLEWLLRDNDVADTERERDPRGPAALARFPSQRTAGHHVGCWAERRGRWSAVDQIANARGQGPLGPCDIRRFDQSVLEWEEGVANYIARMADRRRNAQFAYVVIHLAEPFW